MEPREQVTVSSGAIVYTDNLLIYLDAGNNKSYPGTGVTWKNLSSKSGIFSLNSPSYDSSYYGGIPCDPLTPISANGKIETTNFNLGTTVEIWVNTNPATIFPYYDLLQVSSSAVNPGPGSPYNGFYIYTAPTSNVANISLLSYDFISASPSPPELIIQIPNNQPQYCAWTINPGTAGDIVTCTAYKNGIQDSVGTAFSMRTDSYDISIYSSIYTFGVSYPLDGILYQCRLYNKCLSSSEILNNYNAIKHRFNIF